MEYSFAEHPLDDWEDDLVVRLDEDDGIKKESPEEISLVNKSNHELFTPPEQYRPMLFDIQIAAVALAADKLWQELRPVFGAVIVRNIQLEKIHVDKYSAIDPSEIEKGAVIFRFEAEANYPQYRRAMLTVNVPIVNGRAREGLFFTDSKGSERVLSKEAMEKFMGIKEWFTLSRPGDVEIGQIDRVEHTDYPSYMRTRYTWDIGF